MSATALFWNVFQVLVGYNLVMPLFLYLIWLAVRRKPRLQETPASDAADYAIIVTAYEQADSLPAVATSILQLRYTNFLVYIVADKCDVSSLNFNDDRIILLRPNEILGSNTRSHFYAIERFRRAHNRITIIDSDNLVDGNYLTRLNECFDRGFEAVQGIREAKNMDTTIACLDAARDIYYHFYDGKILFETGSSATLSGSGMAFSTALYRDCLEKLDITGAGFDKVLQNEIVKRGKRIAFAEKAVVYDEKTSQSDQLVNQRSRWINTWFRYFKFGFSLTARGILNLNLNQFLFGIILLRPPLFIFIFMSVFCAMMDIWIKPALLLVWAAAFFCFLSGFLIALLSANTDKRIYRSLINIPGFMFLQVLSLLKVRRANKRSVATRHYHTNVANVNRNED